MAPSHGVTDPGQRAVVWHDVVISESMRHILSTQCPLDSRPVSSHHGVFPLEQDCAHSRQGCFSEDVLNACKSARVVRVPTHFPDRNSNLTSLHLTQEKLPPSISLRSKMDSPLARQEESSQSLLQVAHLFISGGCDRHHKELSFRFIDKEVVPDCEKHGQEDTD